MRRSLTVLAAVAVLVGVMAVPAAADKPVVFETGEFTVTDIDPCTGLLHDLTFNVTIYDHFHKNNIVTKIDKVGTTDSGYVLIGGSHHMVERADFFMMNYKDVWRNPDTGAKMHAIGKIRFAGNSPEIETFELRCIGAPTILP